MVSRLIVPTHFNDVDSNFPLWWTQPRCVMGGRGHDASEYPLFRKRIFFSLFSLFSFLSLSYDSADTLECLARVPSFSDTAPCARREEWRQKQAVFFTSDDKVEIVGRR